MNRLEFFEYCEKVLSANRLSEFSGKDALDLYFRLSEELEEANRHMNLTAITDMKGIIVRHIADSLYLLKYCDGAKTLADVGCGAGFPSLPCAIAAKFSMPSLRIFGFDSTKKRVDYVNTVAEKLGLDNIRAYAGRAEDFGHRADFRERFDICSARAVSEMYILSELCLPLVKVGGKMVALKGAKGKEELISAASHIPNLGGSAPELVEYTLNDAEGGDEYRSVIICKKVRQTNDLFPRNYSKIVSSAKSRK